MPEDPVRTTASCLERGGNLQVRVRCPVLTEAIGRAATRGGWHLTSRRQDASILVTDVAPHRTGSPQPADGATVLVCEPTPAAARVALDAMARPSVAAVLCADDPDALVVAIDALFDGRATLPVRLLELAGRMPPFTERQLELLGGVIAGQSNREIAKGLGLSVASVKRDLALAVDLVGARGRAGLVAATVGLGLTARPLDPKPK